MEFRHFADDGSIWKGNRANELSGTGRNDFREFEFARARQVAAGAIFLAPARPADSPGEHPRTAPDLTQRERTILTAISSGQTTSAISRELWVSEHTIKFHLTNIYRKLGVSNRAGAIRFAIEHGLAA